MRLLGVGDASHARLIGQATSCLYVCILHEATAGVKLFSISREVFSQPASWAREVLDGPINRRDRDLASVDVIGGRGLSLNVAGLRATKTGPLALFDCRANLYAIRLPTGRRSLRRVTDHSAAPRGTVNVQTAFRVGVAALPLALLVCLSLGESTYGQNAFRYPEGAHGRGELRYHQNIPVLVVRGSHAEMGEQIGSLALKPALKAIELVEGFAEWQIPSRLRPFARLSMNALYASFPAQYRQELDAMAVASGADIESLIMANTIIDLQELVGCSSLLVSAARSATGGTLYGRNMDLPYIEGLADYSLLIVYVPEKGHAFAMPNLPGFLMLASGMNDQGLALGSQSVSLPKDGSPRFDATGIASAVAGRTLMEECGDVSAAAKWLGENRLNRCVSIAACDRARHAVFEVTTKRALTRTDDSGICCATNHFRTTELATNLNCLRYARLETSNELDRVEIADVAVALDDVNQGRMTVHSMVFEPSILTVHLAMGPGPVTGRPLTRIDLAPHFRDQ